MAKAKLTKLKGESPMICDLRRTPTDQLIPKELDGYVDVGLIDLLDKLAFSRPLVLEGPKGAGNQLPERTYFWNVANTK